MAPRAHIFEYLITRERNCLKKKISLIRGSVLLCMGLEVSKDHTRRRLSLPVKKDVTLNYFSSDKPVIMFPAMMIMDQTSEAVSKPQLNAFFSQSSFGHGVSSQN